MKNLLKVQATILLSLACFFLHAQNAKTMQQQKNIEAIQQIYGFFGTGNIPSILNTLTDDVVWIDPGFPHIPYAGKRSGKSEVAQFFPEMGKTITFTHFNPQEFFADGDAVFVKGFFAGKNNSTSKTFETEWLMIWRLKDGKVYFYQAYIDTRSVAAAME